MKLIITGSIPSLKNGKEIARKKDGTPFVRSNDRVKAWMDAAVEELALQFLGYIVTQYPIAITITVYYGNRRRHDLDNAVAGVMDALTKARIIEDDDTTHVECIVAQLGGYDKDNPRVEIDLDE